MGHDDTSLKFSVIIDLQIFENFFVQSFKRCVKNTYFVASYSKDRLFSITRFDILILSNILHLEMNFESLY